MRFGLVAVLVVGALTLVGRDAEAQARGVHALETFVHPHELRLECGHQLVRVGGARGPAGIPGHAVETVAVVSTARPATNPSTVVVTVDFSRN